MNIEINGSHYNVNMGTYNTTRSTELHVLQQFISSKLVNVSKFCIPYITINLVEKLNTSKATEYDNINTRFLKLSATVIVPFPTHIFNCSIQSQTFQNAFKVGKVVPIYTQGDTCNTSNYRPTSILPFISLVFETHSSFKTLPRK